MPPHEAIVHHCRLLRLPSLAETVPEALNLAQQQDWSLENFLLYLLEQELLGRRQRRIERLLRAAHLPPDKTFDRFEQTRLPLRLRRQLPELVQGDFINQADNILIFGQPGTGKTHLAAALAYEWVQRDYSVWFTPTYKLVDGLLRAKRDYELERELKRLDRFQVVILDDIGYVQQSREEMEVLFTFLAERYERRSVVITSNLVFSQWDQIFKDPLTTAAAIDRVVHHSRIIEFGPEMTSVRAEQAARRQQQQKELKQQEVLKQQQQTTVLHQNQPDQSQDGQI
jgi:DNA replication protein DnaC